MPRPLSRVRDAVGPFAAAGREKASDGGAVDPLRTGGASVGVGMGLSNREAEAVGLGYEEVPKEGLERWS